MSFVEVFIIFIIVVILIMYIHNYVNSEVEYVKSRIDGRSYLVLSLPDKQEAADYLAEINQDIVKVVKHLRAKHPKDENFERLYKNYDPDAVSEGSPESNYTSYTVNKSSMVICIRQPGNAFVRKNVVLYPVLHELGHIACIEVGHTKKFWEIFKTILIGAMEIGVYEKIDFKKKPEPYCGISISSSIV
jgi:hypothetical protein